MIAALKAWLGSNNFKTTWQESDGSFSWGRVLGTATTVTSIWGFVHVVRLHGTIPDAATLAGLGTFGVFPFFASKGIAALARPSANQ
jgi:hypothetical protein